MFTESEKTNREKIIGDLENLINQYQSQMNEWLGKFGWTKESLFHRSNSTNAFDCPYNPQHKKISSKNYAKHLRICKLKSQNHTRDDVIEYGKHIPIPASSCIQIDEKEHQMVCNNAQKCVSLTTNHYLVNYSPQERLKLYNYSREKLKGLGVAHEHLNEQAFLTDFNSHLEQSSNENSNFSAKREPKRRTKSYRTSGPRSYIQELRNLIQMQMESIREKQPNDRVDERLVADEQKNSSRYSRKKHKEKKSKKKKKHSSP
jgi:hypothetical protein